MFYISVKINTKDKQSAIDYLKSLVGSVSYIKYNKENDIVTISDSEDHDDIIDTLGSYGTIIKKNGEKDNIDSFIDESISQSSDIQELASDIYRKLGITVRRSCDKRFASMISSFIESGEPVCMSTVEETEFSSNNFTTLAKACREKGFEPFEFIEKLCDKYSAINRGNKDVEQATEVTDQQRESKKNEVDLFIDESILQSSDIQELASDIYRKLGITVRRSCDKKFASMISSFIESGEPVCMSTVEETDFSPNNFKTLAKACREKGFEPLEFIGRVCEKYSAKNKDIIDKESITQPIQVETQEIKPLSTEEVHQTKTQDIEDIVKDNQPKIPLEIKADTTEQVKSTEPEEIAPVTIEPKKENLEETEHNSDIVKNPVRSTAIKHTFRPLPKAQSMTEPKTAKRKSNIRRVNLGNPDELPAGFKMARLRSNYKLAFENKGAKKQVITLEKALAYLSTDALEILSLGVSDEPDINKGKELIEAEARRNERGDIGYQIRQVYLRLKKIFEARSDEYPVKDPLKTFHYFQQICANQDSFSLMRMISHNLVAQDRVDDAINFCNEVDGKKKRTDIYTDQNRQTDSLIKELSSVKIARMILDQIHGDSVYSDENFMNTLETTMDKNNIKPGQIWLGRDETGQADILLSDVWYDKNLAITSFLQGMLK